MQSTTAGQHSFAKIPGAEIQRSKLNRSCGYKTTFDAGFLIPVFVDEALPGDTFTLRMHTFARMATPLHPVLDNLFLDSHFFFVPYRLVWDNWEKFNGEQVDPGDSTDFTIPQADIGVLGCGYQSLCDYMGVPTDAQSHSISSLPLRAYIKIWNEWFRDENMQDSVPCPTGDGPEVWADYILQKRGKRHDYFTSCLPWPQKGDAPPLIVSGVVPIISTGDGIPTWDSGNQSNAALEAQATSSDIRLVGAPPSSTSPLEWNTTKLEADLATATSNSINSLRQAFQIQRLYERDARGGSRYTEIIRAHFGVTSPDQRLQRPEYLGGGSQNISITPVPQTSSSDTQPTVQGNLAAYAVSTGSNHSFSKSFTEHGVVIGLVSVRADLNYQNGLDRMWSRSTRFDFYWPALAHLGEQAVLNKEIYMVDTVRTADNDVFGYQERWAEYRYKPSLITGQFRSLNITPLDTWHLAQEFTATPVLGENFIEETPPMDRVIAVPSEPDFLFDAFFDYTCARPMPTYSVPGMIDHF